MVDYITSIFIIVIIVSFLLRFAKADSDKNPVAPFATYKYYPVVGHLFSFIHNRTAFLLECEKRYGTCFRIQVFYQTFTMLSSPADCATVVRNPAFYFPVNDLSAKVFDVSSDLEEHPDLHAAGHRQYVQYLKNSDGLRPMIVEFVRQIRRQMQLEKTAITKKKTTSEWISRGILELSHAMLFVPSTVSLFGEIPAISLENDFRLFDKNIHYFSTNLPRRICSWLFPKEFTARTRLNKTWTGDLRSSRLSELMQARKRLFDENSDWLTERDECGFQTALFWASLGNTIPAVFWSLYYILQDEKAKEILTQEIDSNLPRFSLDNDTNEESIIEEWTPERLSSCVYLDSAITEVLRLNGAPLIIRRSRQETNVVLQDGRVLSVERNESLAHFVGLTHMDEKFFPDPNKFIFDRFLNKTADSIPGYMPFGGGKSMCPGRFFAKNEMKICVAMLIRYMEYKFIDTGKAPTQKAARVGFGVAPPNRDVSILYRYKA